jgi:oligopeptide transport system permease protein
MLRFVFKRTVSILFTLFLVASCLFVLLRFVPGGPFDAERAVPEEVLQQLNAKYHLDDPLYVQYADWMGGLLLRGDLGPTYKYPNRTVNEIIGLSLPVSMKLGAMAMALALLIGIPLGVMGALRRNSWMDAAAMGVALAGISVPRFVLAPILIWVFALKLYWVPVARWEGFSYMILPVFCAALPDAAYIARLARGGMLEIIQSDFIRTARAKGLSERQVVLQHALRGALLPVVSFLGPGFSGLLVGSLVIEKIFDIPGMGRYLVEAALNRDYNLIMGVTLVYGALLMGFNLIVDIAYGFIDPRVRVIQ